MLIATYDYWGYYNVCFLGDEVKDPGKTIPRALLLSILLVGCLYVLMNISILGVVPWQEITHTGQSNRGLYVVSVFMQRIYGTWAANLVTALVMWTAFASVFSLLLGYSRVPYAAALDGNYFQAFARVHPQHRFPYVSLLALGGVAVLFCFFSLADVIAALVVIRITLQFLVQAIGRDRVAHPAAGFAAAVSHVAVSAAGFAGVRRIHLCAGLPHQLVEAGSLRAGHPDYRHRHLHGAGMAKSGMAVWNAARLRPTVSREPLTMTEAIKTPAPESLPPHSERIRPGRRCASRSSARFGSPPSFPTPAPGCRTWARAG